MRGFNQSSLGLGLVVIGGLCEMAQKLAAQDTPLVFTVHINKYAGVDSATVCERRPLVAAA